MLACPPPPSPNAILHLPAVRATLRHAALTLIKLSITSFVRAAAGHRSLAALSLPTGGARLGRCPACVCPATMVALASCRFLLSCAPAERCLLRGPPVGARGVPRARHQLAPLNASLRARCLPACLPAFRPAGLYFRHPPASPLVVRLPPRPRSIQAFRASASPAARTPAPHRQRLKSVSQSALSSHAELN